MNLKRNLVPDSREGDIMKQKKSKKSFLLLNALCAVFMTGCTSQKHYDEVEKQALKYYREKYDLKNVTIEKAYKAGNNGLFGYVGVKNRAYDMSDGHAVYWDEYTETFADNAQADEILNAFRSSFLEPLLSDFTLPLKTNGPVTLNRTNHESFDECVFTETYTGDIHAFLKAEQPRLAGFTFVLESTDREKAEKEITAFYNALEGNVKGWSSAYILNEGLDELSGDEWTVDTKELNVTAEAKYDDEYGLRWYRQAYIEVYEGIYVTSRKSNFVFNEGDVLFEEAGTCAGLQQMLDDGYHAMPVDAEENKKGGYMVHDQRHEKRVILDDPDLPYFSLKLSQRVLDALDSRNEISVYFLDLREGGQNLMKYYGLNSNASYSVYPVCRDREGKGEYDNLNPDYFYYFGTHHYEAYEDK